MKRMFAALLSTALFVSLAAAQGHAAMGSHAMGTHTMKGYLVDQMCGKNMPKAGAEKAMQKAKRHTRECALEDDCAASGYGLVSGGKFYPFNDAGSKMAADYLKNTKKKSDIEVNVVGTMDGMTINVQAIHDVKTVEMKEAKKKG